MNIEDTEVLDVIGFENVHRGGSDPLAEHIGLRWVLFSGLQDVPSPKV
jgi:hypothetical protein